MKINLIFLNCKNKKIKKSKKNTDLVLSLIHNLLFKTVKSRIYAFFKFY